MSDVPVVQDPLARALQAVRAEPSASTWSVLADDVMRKARSIVRSDETLLAAVGIDGGRTFVSTRVLLAVLRRVLARSGTYAPDDIDFRVEGTTLVAVRLSLVAAFRTDLVRLAAEVRGAVVDELDALLPGAPGVPGAPALAPVEVDVAIVDVVEGDPRTS